MPIPINDASVKILWENNPDTPISSSNLSKLGDVVASYSDFDIEPAPHREGTILLAEAGNLNIIMKKECLFSIINTAQKNGEMVLSINEHYRIFDTGLEDLRLTIDDMDDNPANPINNQTTHEYWGANKEWFVYVCDKFDTSLEKQQADDYGGGAQILISQGRYYPIGAVPGDPTRDYSADDTRKVGGFKSDATGYIIASSVWDVSFKFQSLAAKKYYILDDFLNDSEDAYGRHLYRPLRLSDLDSSAGVNNVFNNDVTVKGNFYVKNQSNTTFFEVNVTGNIATISTANLTTNNSTIVMNGTVSCSITSPTITLSGTTNIIGTTNITGSINLTNGGAIINGDISCYAFTGKTIQLNGDDTSANAGSITFRSNPGGGTGDASFIKYYAYSGEDCRLEINISNENTDYIYLNGGVRFGNNSGAISGLMKSYSSQPAMSGTEWLGYDGYFTATQIYNAIFNDLAEFFLSKDPIDYGKVYVLYREANVTISKKRADKNVVGVCTSSPAFVMKSEYQAHGGVPIALAGTVKVCVKSIVHEGDELVSDADGYAVRANLFERIFKRGAIIGKALSDSYDSTPTQILMLVT